MSLLLVVDMVQQDGADVHHTLIAEVLSTAPTASIIRPTVPNIP